MKYPMSVEVITDAYAWWSKWFRAITVPALVSPEVMTHTCPIGVVDRRLRGEGTDTVVASAEQSFLQLEKEGTLKPGDWMALTPCYRDEPVMDEIHLPVFLKLELIRLSDDSNFYTRSDAHSLAQKMTTFLMHQFNLPTEIVETEDGFDVMYEDLELGSYGVRRSLTGKSYIYGTGLAEPRTSIAIRRVREKEQSADRKSVV